MTRRLVGQFVADLGCSTDAPIVLFFDSVNEASSTVCDWLMDTLLVQLSRLRHVRVVVAGRTLPEASGSYATICCSHQLTPVEEDEVFIIYCQLVGADLIEQSIRDFARAFDYKPGLFVDYVFPKFVARKIARG